MNERIELDRATAERILIAVDHPVAVQSVSLLAGGRHDSVFAVKRAAGPDLVIKFYPRDWDWMMRKEVFALDLVHQHGLDAPVPTLLGADDSKSVLPHSFVVMTRLHGRHVDLTDDRIAAAFNREAGALLRRLHTIELEAFGYVGGEGIIEPRATNRDYIRTQLEQKLRTLGDQDLRSTVERYVSTREALLDWPTACYCHNDCHGGNVLMERSPSGWRISALIDFEDVVAADPLLDLAKTFYYSLRRTKATLDALASGYGSLRDDWREGVLLYALFHAVELWAWLLEIGETERIPAIATDVRALVAGEPLPVSAFP